VPQKNAKSPNDERRKTSHTNGQATNNLPTLLREHSSGWDEWREAFDLSRLDVYRDAMLAEYGTWALVLKQPPSVVFLQALRSISDLSLEELKQEKARLPGIVRQGTRNRIEYLEERLREWGCRDIMTLTRL
jgi:hypothetical protein